MAMQITPAEARIRAERGAAFLDEFLPGWERRVKLERLELNQCMRCVLGQLFLGGYEQGVEHFKMNDIQTRAMGFMLNSEDLYGEALDMMTRGQRDSFVCDGSYDKSYDVLTAAWKDIIAARRAKPVVAPEPELVLV